MKRKQKSVPNNVLIRSDEKLAMLGLFSIALTLGVFFYMPGMLTPVSNTTAPINNEVYKVEEVPLNPNSPPETYAEEPVEPYIESYFDMEDPYMGQDR